VIADARFHRGGHARRLMHPPEVVIHEVECHGCGVILDPFENAFVRRVKRRIGVDGSTRERIAVVAALGAERLAAVTRHDDPVFFPSGRVVIDDSRRRG
jgi:hypothetical protein